MRLLVFLFCLLTVPRMVWASSALFRLPANAVPPALTVTNDSGNAEVKVLPIQPADDVTVVLLLDSLTAEQLSGVKRDLLAAFTVARGGKLRLGLMQNNTLLFAGPFKTRLRFKAALDEIHLSSPGGAALSGEAVIESIFNNAAQFGSNWSHVVFAGDAVLSNPATVDYAVGLLEREFATHQIRVSWLASTPMPEAWQCLFKATGGETLGPGLSELEKIFDNTGIFLQAEWTVTAPSAGFILRNSVIKDKTGAVLGTIPELAAGPEENLPSIALYGQLRAKSTEANALLQQSAISTDIGNQIREAIKIALGINPRDVEGLTAAALLYERSGDYAGAVQYRTSLLEVLPQDGAAHALAAHDFLLSSDLNNAEAALQEALRLGARNQMVLEDFARVKIARKDDASALPYLEEALQVDQKRQDLWFIKAGVESRLAKPELAIVSYRRGLALGGIHLDATSALLKLYIESKQKNEAIELAVTTTNILPADAALRRQFAISVDELHLNAEALAVWRRVLEVQQESQQAHERIARLLLEAGDLVSAETAATEGLSVVPNSAELYLVKSEVLEKEGHLYAARRTAEEGAGQIPEKAVLERVAQLEETFVGRGAAAYEKWAQSSDLSAEEKLGVLQRGLEVSLRDDDIKHAQVFANELSNSGHPEFRDLLARGPDSSDSVLIPGGLSALAFVAHAADKTGGDKFFVEFCRALIEHVQLVDTKEAKEYISNIDQYLEKIAALEQLGKRDGNTLKISLSLQGKDARKHTEEVLDLLGIKLRSGKAGVELDFGESKSQAKKQETLAALAIDQVGIQDAFRGGKPYILEIPYESARIYPNEKLWRETFFAHGSQPGGFVGALLHAPRVARLYLGMSYLDRETITPLLGAVDLKTLHDHYADLFFSFAPALAVHNGKAVCAGGPEAEAIWERLAGASPKQPGAFFRALLEKDDGKLLAYFYTLSHLDRSRQAFFTANAARTNQFYKLFVEYKEHQHGPVTMTRDTYFEDFLRSVPLAPNGHVSFPGSPAVWMVAKGSASADSKIAKVTKASSRWAGSDVEDEVLSRLAQARYREKAAAHSELDNFLAVSHIDAHRSDPLSDESALLLAQRYTDDSATYPYFADLTGLTQADFRQFFTLLDQLGAEPLMDANLRLAQLHALVQWVCLLRQRNRVSDEQATGLFRYTVKRLASGDSSSFGVASMDVAKAVIEACGRIKDGVSPDDLARRCLTGSAQGREQEFQQVLELQNVPSFNALFAIQAAAGPLGGATVDSAVLSKTAAALPVVEIPTKLKLAGKEKDLVLRYRPAAIQKLSAELVQKASSKKPKVTDLDALRRELMHEMEPQVALAVAGVIYAYYLRPSDLLVAEDPLLLRKHRYLEFSDMIKNHASMASAFNPSSDGGGSHFSGGFAEFSVAVGEAAGALLKTGGDAGKQAVSAQLAALRSSSWDMLSESDLRLLGLRVAVAREWIVEAATHPEAQQALGDATMGLLSLSRRADLLNGIATHRWDKAWEAVTLPDLFALGGTYLQYFPSDLWTSSVTRALRSAAADNRGTHWMSLGSVPYRTFGCSHAHWIPMAPFEEYEHRFFPYESAERWAQFKLFLAFQADLAGEDPAELDRVSEKLASKAFRSAQMTDFNDWRSLLAGYATVTSKDVEKALQP